MNHVDPLKSESAKYLGAQCPVCKNPSTLDFMRFQDPHGGERVDSDIFECSSRKHTFVVNTAGIRLLASEGQRVREKVIFQPIMA